MDIKDKVVIVTGASGGIGLAAAKLFFESGAKVVLAARSKDKLDAIVRSMPGALAVAADMTKPEEVRAMVTAALDRFGRVDVLVNNAGQGYYAPVEKIDLDNFREIFELNVLGVVAAMKAVIPFMRDAGGGAIVNINSGTALMAIPGLAAYAATKSALMLLSKTAREELKDDKIVVSSVYPYITITDFGANMMRNAAAPPPDLVPDSTRPPGDTPEYVAALIKEAVQSGAAEIFAHEWMKH